jgi:gliding motility-associated-like protein
MKKQLHFIFITTLSFILFCTNAAAQTLGITSVDARAARCSANGALIVTIQGGTAPFFYTLVGTPRPTQGNGLFPNLPPATYTVQVSDFTGASVSATATVANQYTLPQPPTVSINGSDVTVTANGGRAPFRYAYMPNNDTTIWTNGHLQNNPTFNCVPDGNWTFITYDSCGNFYPLNNIEVLRQPLPQGFCIANADGTTSMGIAPSGSGAPYTFTCVSNFGVSQTNTTGNFPNKIGCTFTITYKDRCNKTYPSQTFRCQTPIALGLRVLCFNYQTGAISVAACGGKSPYIYRYTNPTTGVTTTNSTGVFMAQPNTNPSITVTDNCTTTATTNTTHTNAHTAIYDLCANDGTIRVSGNSGFTYTSGSVDSLGCAGLDTTNMVSTAPYYLELLAANGSVIRYDTLPVPVIDYQNVPNFSTSMTIKFKDRCGVTNTINPIARYDSRVDALVLCSNPRTGEVTLQGINGANNQYQYYYNGSPNNTTGFLTGHFTGLPNREIYEFYVVDACGSATIRIYNHAKATAKYACPFAGTIRIDTARFANNDIFGYMYNSSYSGRHYYPNQPLQPANVVTATYYNSANQPVNTVSYASGATQSGYVIQTTDPNGYLVFTNTCGARDTIFTQQIPSAIELPLSVLCDTIRQIYDTTLVTITPNTVFVLTNTTTNQVVGTNNTGVFFNLPPGTYQMSADFFSVCRAVSTPISVFNATRPQYFIRAHGINQTTACAKGYLLHIDAQFQAPFTLYGGPDNTYLPNAYDFDNLLPGTYYISNACVKDTIVLPEPRYNLAVTTINPICSTQGVNVSVSGGNLANYYTTLFNNEPTLAGHFTNWTSNDYYETYITLQNGSTQTFGGGTGVNGQFVNLPEGGLYTAYLYNTGTYPGLSGGYLGQCPLDTVRFFAPYYERPILTATYGIVCAATNTGNLTATVTHGTAPFTFTIDPASIPAGYTGLTTIVSQTNTATFLGLPAGSYSLHVQDYCLISADYAANVGVFAFTPTFERYCDGRILLKLPLLSDAVYTWTNSSGVTIGTASTIFINNNNAATYSVAVVANGCTYNQSVNVTAQTQASVTANAGADQLTSSNNIALTGNILPSGATGAWTQIGGSTTIINTPNAPYTTVTLNGSNIYTYVWTVRNGAGGCVATDTVRIIFCTFISPAQAHLTAVQPTCTQQGSIQVVLDIGTTATHTFHWNTNSSFANLSNLNAGQYTVTITSNNLCKTPIVLTQTLTGGTRSSFTQTITQCGGSYSINGHTYTQSGIYQDILTNFSGCDSLVTTNLILNRFVLRSQNQTACDTFRMGTHIYTQSGVYQDTLFSTIRCDTILTTNLIINNSQTLTLPIQTACDSLFFQNTWFKRDTILVSLLQMPNGCQRRTLQPIRIPKTTITTLNPLTACTSLFYQNQYFVRDTVLISTAQNSAGCTNTIRQPIKINQNTATLLAAISGCDSVLYNGFTVKRDTIFTRYAPNTQGCTDTIRQPITINCSLTVTQPSLQNCDAVLYNGVTYTRDTVLITFTPLPNTCTQTTRQPIIVPKSVTTVLADIRVCDSIFIYNKLCKNDTVFTLLTQTPQGCTQTTIQKVFVAKSIVTVLPLLTACDSLWYNNTIFKKDTTLILLTQTPQGCTQTTKQSIQIFKSTLTTLSPLQACDSLLYNGVFYKKDTIIQNLSFTAQNCIATTLQPIQIQHLSATITGILALDCNNKTATLLAQANITPTWGIGSNLNFAWSNTVFTAQNTVNTGGIYTVTISTPLCTATKSATVSDEPPLSAALIATLPICHDDPITLTAIQVMHAEPFGSARYQLDNYSLSSDSIFENIAAGTHTVRITDGRNCVWTSTIRINNPPELSVDLGEDKIIYLGDTLHFSPILNHFANVNYEWSSNFATPLYLSCFTCRHPLAIPLQNITYTVKVTDTRGCTATDAVFVRILADKNIFIPNVFTPNDDGKNDVFTVYGSRAVAYIAKAQIFDRWGELIFTADNLPNFKGNGCDIWDGTFKTQILNPDVFVYRIEVVFIDGSSRIYTGDVTLVR